MPVPSPAFDSDCTQEQEVLLKWREFRAKVFTAIADFNATSGEQVWSVNEASETDGPVVIQAIVDELDFVNITLKQDARKIVCGFGSHVPLPPLEFEVGRGDEHLHRGETPISVAAALDLILMPLLLADFTL